MTPEEKKKADEAEKLRLAKEKETAKIAEETKKADEDDRLAKEAEKAKAIPQGNYIMKVTHLSWGKNNMSHFYADKKPLINAKVMGKYATTLKVWLDAKWIEKGSYKK